MVKRVYRKQDFLRSFSLSKLIGRKLNSPLWRASDHDEGNGMVTTEEAKGKIKYAHSGREINEKKKVGRRRIGVEKWER